MSTTASPAATTCSRTSRDSVDGGPGRGPRVKRPAMYFVTGPSAATDAISEATPAK